MREYLYSDELKHYGVKGMKWGVRKEYIPKGRKPSKNSSERYKKLTKDGLEFVAVSLATPITYYAITKIKSKISENFRNSNSKSDIKNIEELEKIKKTKKYSKDEDMKEVNPDFDPNKIETCVNCTFCTAAYDMRRRGYDVTAGFTKRGKYDDEVASWYNGAKVESIFNDTNSKKLSSVQKQEAVIKKLESFGDGARGHFSAVDKTFSFAHDVVFEIENKKLVFRDCQTNKKYEDPKKYLRCWDMDDATFIRVDNLEYSGKIIEALRRK